MRIFYVNVIEQNATYGAEVFMNRALLQLGHETHTLDYRKHRQSLPQAFLNAPDFDAFLLQRGDYFPLELVEACQCPRVFYSSELVSRCSDQHHLFQSGLFDQVFVRTPACKQAIIENGWMPDDQISVFLSAFDEQTHRRLEGAQRDIDVLFVGGVTQRRREIITRLKKTFNVVACQAYGPDMAKMFNRAKIAINIHAEEFLDTETRVFEALGSGAFLISETLSEENPFQTNQHFVEVRSIDEMEEKIAHYLSNEVERLAIAESGHDEAVARHSYSARAKEIAEHMQRLLNQKSDWPKPALNREAVQRLISPQEKNQPEPSVSAAVGRKPGALRIGIVTTWFERGAAYVSKQYREALQNDHEVFIYARGGETSGRGDPNWDDDRVTWGKPVQASVPTAIDLNDFRAWLQKCRINTVIFNEQHWWAPVVGCSQMGIKTGAYVDYYTELTIPIFGCYDFLLCNTKRHYSAFDWHPQAKYVPWGTDVEVYKPMQYELVNPDVVTFFHSAGYNPSRKGTDFLVAAFRDVKGPARLVVHTQKPVQLQFPELAPLVNALQQEGRLVYEEKTVPAPGLYHLGDVYVYPSRLDGIGLTQAEALACGLPLIVSDNGPMNEFVDDSNGRVVKIDRLYARNDGYYWPQCRVNIEDLTRQMQYYVDNKDQLPAMKQAARAYAETNLDWKKNSAHLPKLLSEMGVIPQDRKKLFYQQAQQYEQRRAALSARG